MNDYYKEHEEEIKGALRIILELAREDIGEKAHKKYEETVGKELDSCDMIEEFVNFLYECEK